MTTQKSYPIFINGVNLQIQKIVVEGHDDIRFSVFARDRWGNYTTFIGDYLCSDELRIAELYKCIKGHLSHLIETLEETGVKFF